MSFRLRVPLIRPLSSAVYENEQSTVGG